MEDVEDTPAEDLPALSTERVDEVSTKLALELAAELAPPDEIISRYGLTVAEFGQIAKTPRFKQLLREAKEYWHSDANAKERIQAKATMLVEDSMLDMYSIVQNKALPAGSRIDSFKTLTKMAKVSGEGQDAGASVGSRFSITINLGDEPNEKVVVDAPVVNTEDVAATLEGGGAN